MKALDTNVLVRFLVNDYEQQAKAVYMIFKEAGTNKELLFAPALIILKTVWVLESVYTITKQEILDSRDNLLPMPILEFEAQSMVRSFVTSARETEIDLSDLLIDHSSRFLGCEYVISFDKRASAFGLSEIIK